MGVLQERITSTKKGSITSVLVLAHHAALVTALAPGTLSWRLPGSKEETLGVTGGFSEVSNNRATVLADAVGVAKA